MKIYFETVPHLRAGTVPESWAELVVNSREKTVDGFYDITKIWFEGEADETAGESPGFLNSSNTDPLAVPQPPLPNPPSNELEAPGIH